MLRIENSDVVFRTEKEKFIAVADNIAELHEKRQPVLVGTISIEKSERLSQILKRKGVRHVVLNAKHHEREAEIVAQAGRKGTVTISTNMAGRGTDILLGGNPEFMARQELVKKGQRARHQRGRRRHQSHGAGRDCCASTTRARNSRVAEADWDADVQGATPKRAQQEHDEVIAAGRPAHPGHRAARVAAHRQSAARTRRPPGRSRRVALLPLARRRPDAHLRRRVDRAR